MRQVSLREFRMRGSKALEAIPAGETLPLPGQDGPAYFLVPVLGEVAVKDRESRRANAKASLRESWRTAKSSGLDRRGIDQIDAEIRAVSRKRP